MCCFLLCYKSCIYRHKGHELFIRAFNFFVCVDVTTQVDAHYEGKPQIAGFCVYGYFYSTNIIKHSRETIKGGFAVKLELKRLSTWKLKFRSQSKTRDTEKLTRRNNHTVSSKSS